MKTELYLNKETKLRDYVSSWIEIDRGALLHNLSQIRQAALPGAEILAVVKANAYGHGLLEVVQCLDEKVAYFGVASIEEALKLRRFEVTTPILLFGVHNESAEEIAIQEKITLSISSLEQAKEISRIARKLGERAVVHIKVDTGMGRLGIPKLLAAKEIEEISVLDMLSIEGVYTHFPQGEDEADPFTKEQIQSFSRVISQASSKGVHFAYQHASNSTAILNHRAAHFNLVRPGITLYGIYPSMHVKRKLSLKSVLNWRTRVVLLKKINAKETVGYGRTFQALEKTTIGILSIGYSSGYPFALSNKGVVLLNGKYYPVVGRVSMDYITVDFGQDGDKVHTGDAVTLLGNDGREEISAEMLAERAGTIPYEIVTQINPTIPRYVL
jgi:alanine racemase